MDLKTLLIEVNHNKVVMERILEANPDSNVQYMKGYIAALEDVLKYARDGY